MKTIFLTRLPDQDAPEIVEVQDVFTFLETEFGHWSRVGRVVHVPDGRVVTPRLPSDVMVLRDLPGPFTVEAFPRIEPGTAVAILMMIASAMVQSLLAPKIPEQASRTVRNESPNNGLSGRTNEVRVNGRLPEIFGQVRSYFDLLEAHTIFENHVEKEIAYLCIGRGSYEVESIRDGTTRIDQIAGAAAAVYGPHTSPNSGTPQLTIGNAIDTPVMMTKRENGINGQTLQPPNHANVAFEPMRFESPNLVRMMSPDVDFTEYFLSGDVVTISRGYVSKGTFSYSIEADEATFELTEALAGTITFAGSHSSDWAIGQALTISNGTVHWDAVSGGDSGAIYTKSGNVNGVYLITGVSEAGGNTTLALDIENNSRAWYFQDGEGHQAEALGGPRLTRPSTDIIYDLSGVYTIATLSGDLLTLDNPAAVNPDWDVMTDDYGGISPTLQVTIEASKERWVGWLELESVEPIDRLITNIVSQGLYGLKDSGRQVRLDVDVELQAQPMDEFWAATGAIESFTGTVQGSAVSRVTRALTMDITLAATSQRWAIRLSRTSDTDTDFGGQVVDDVQWRDLFAASVIDKPHFGDVTTVQIMTHATDAALAVKERKANALVTRKLPKRVSGSDFTTELYPTTDVADILSFICLDPKLGNRAKHEVDFDNFYDTAAEIREYFGIDVAQFNYTIDNDNLSFEEIFRMVATAVYCSGYRRGSVLRLFFERETDDSALLFNHRNKKPASEHRTTTFGPKQAYDGVEFQWVRPSDDSIQTIYLPADRSAINAKREETVGIRIFEQAHIHAWRLYNKILYQNETTRFDALPEANLLTLKERILCSNNVRNKSQDGEIVEVDGLMVALSQPVEWDPLKSYVMQLQNSDALVESMDITPGGNTFTAVLSRAPRTPIIASGYNPTKYQIVDTQDTRRARPFLVEEKSAPNEDTTIPLVAINYDARYYANDKDFA
ncbi:hypothetical protein H0A71_06125 [Alcaligenaceae bacterium]|nr:hypothetical protein [Alcaligenaceae bacterium]